MKINFLVLPGIGNSGSMHWQTLWEQSNSDFIRVQQRDWDHPVCSEWAANLEKAVERAGPSTILIVHSLACLMVAHWAQKTKNKICGAMLVAVPDPDGPQFPKEAIGFSPVPLRKFSFQSILIASSNDPYASIEFAQRYSFIWGSRFVNVGAAGHINATSGLGHWPEGFSLLQSFLV